MFDPRTHWMLQTTHLDGCCFLSSGMCCVQCSVGLFFESFMISCILGFWCFIDFVFLKFGNHVVSNCQLKLRDFVLCFLIFFRFQASLDLCCFQCSLDLHRMYLSKLCLNKLIFHVMEDLPKVLYVYIYHSFFLQYYTYFTILSYITIFFGCSLRHVFLILLPQGDIFYAQVSYFECDVSNKL